jgi:hypothetical protein
VFPCSAENAAIAACPGPFRRHDTVHQIAPGDVEGPGLQYFNLSLTKFFNIRENVKLRIRADFINAFNHANFQGPETNLSNSGFGTISAAYPPRNIQLGLKLQF